MTEAKYLRFIIPLILLGLIPLSLGAQRLVVNNAGERVVVQPDGSWRYAVPSDSLLLTKDPYQKTANHPRASGQTMNQGEHYEFLLRQWIDLYKAIKNEKIEAQIKFRDATNAKFKASEEYQNAQSNKKIIEPHLYADIEETFESSVKDLKLNKKRQKSIRALLEDADKVNALLSKLTEKKVSKIRGQFNNYLNSYEPQQIQKQTKQPTQKNDKLTQSGSMTKSGIAMVSVPPMSPEMTHKRPAYYTKSAYRAKPFDCTFTTDSVDVMSGRTRIETAPGILFTYTEKELRPYFKDKDLMKCLGRLSKLGPYIYLDIEFQIASSHSQSNFGSLQTGSLLRFQLMNEESVSLYNVKTNTGRIDAYSGHTIFTGQYALGKKELKALKKSGLNKMRVMWSTGFEDYDVYNLDFLINHINCLEAGSHKKPAPKNK